MRTQKKVPKEKGAPSLVRFADSLALQSVRRFADGTSMYRGERSSSLTRPLRGLILTALQGSAATEGLDSVIKITKSRLVSAYYLDIYVRTHVLIKYIIFIIFLKFTVISFLLKLILIYLNKITYNIYEFFQRIAYNLFVRVVLGIP